MDRVNSEVWRNCMGTMALAIIAGGLTQYLHAPDPLPAVVAGIVYFGTPALVLLSTVKGWF